MNKYKLNIERLRKLADHLVSEKCKEIFYMVGPRDENSQGIMIPLEAIPALDSAISESYKIFPEEWIWNEEDEVAYLLEDKSMNPTTSAAIFYGLDESELRHLFIPFNQDPEIFGGKMLEAIIMPYHIGENIYQFLDRNKKESN